MCSWYVRADSLLHMLHSKPVWELGEKGTCFSDKKDEIFLLSFDTIIHLKQLPHKIIAFLVIVSDLLCCYYGAFSHKFSVIINFLISRTTLKRPCTSEMSINWLQDSKLWQEKSFEYLELNKTHTLRLKAHWFKDKRGQFVN